MQLTGLDTINGRVATVFYKPHWPVAPRDEVNTSLGNDSKTFPKIRFSNHRNKSAKPPLNSTNSWFIPIENVITWSVVSLIVAPLEQKKKFAFIMVFFSIFLSSGLFQSGQMNELDQGCCRSLRFPRLGNLKTLYTLHFFFLTIL